MNPQTDDKTTRLYTTLIEASHSRASVQKIKEKLHLLCKHSQEPTAKQELSLVFNFCDDLLARNIEENSPKEKHFSQDAKQNFYLRLLCTQLSLILLRDLDDDLLREFIEGSEKSEYALAKLLHELELFEALTIFGEKPLHELWLKRARLSDPAKFKRATQELNGVEIGYLRQLCERLAMPDITARLPQPCVLNIPEEADQHRIFAAQIAEDPFVYDILIRLSTELAQASFPRYAMPSNDTACRIYLSLARLGKIDKLRFSDKGLIEQLNQFFALSTRHSLNNFSSYQECSYELALALLLSDNKAWHAIFKSEKYKSKLKAKIFVDAALSYAIICDDDKRSTEICKELNDILKDYSSLYRIAFGSNLKLERWYQESLRQILPLFKSAACLCELSDYINVISSHRNNFSSNDTIEKCLNRNGQRKYLEHVLKLKGAEDSSAAPAEKN